MRMIGRTQNKHDSANVSDPIILNDTTAVIISSANVSRIFFQAFVTPGISDFGCFIRLYAATVDNSARGIWVGSYQFGNDTYFSDNWKMPNDNIYTGEISAILEAGNADRAIYVTEY